MSAYSYSMRTPKASIHMQKERQRSMSKRFLPIAYRFSALFEFLCLCLACSIAQEASQVFQDGCNFRVLLIAVSLDGSALVSNRYWRKAVMYARTGECQICMKNRKRSLEGKNPLTGGRAQRDLTRATSLLGSGQGRRSDFVAQHLKNAPDLIGQQVKEPC